MERGGEGRGKAITVQSNTAMYIIVNIGAPTCRHPNTVFVINMTHGAIEISRGCPIPTTRTTRLTIEQQH